MNNFIVLIAVFGIGICGSAQGALVSWNTFGNSGTETSELSVFNDPNLSPSTMTLGSGIGSVGNADRFGGRSWFDSGNPNPTSLPDAISDNEYFEFTIAPNAGYSFTPTSFVFNWERTGTGPNALTMRSNADNYSSNLGTILDLPTSNASDQTLVISGIANVTSVTTFRLYGYGATTSPGNGGFDAPSDAVNITLNGSVTAVPEPASIALLALGTVGVVVQHRRRKKATSL